MCQLSNFSKLIWGFWVIVVSIYSQLKILNLSNCLSRECKRDHGRKVRETPLRGVCRYCFITKPVGGSGLVFVAVKVSWSSIKFSRLRFSGIFHLSQISTGLILLTNTRLRSLFICSGRHNRRSEPNGGVSCSSVVLILRIDRLVDSF